MPTRAATPPDPRRPLAIGDPVILTFAGTLIRGRVTAATRHRAEIVTDPACRGCPRARMALRHDGGRWRHRGRPLAVAHADLSCPSRDE